MRFADCPRPELLIVVRSLVALGGLLMQNLFARVFRMKAAGTPAIPMGPHVRHSQRPAGPAFTAPVPS